MPSPININLDLLKLITELTSPGAQSMVDRVLERLASRTEQTTPEFKSKRGLKLDPPSMENNPTLSDLQKAHPYLFDAPAQDFDDIDWELATRDLRMGQPMLGWEYYEVPAAPTTPEVTDAQAALTKIGADMVREALRAATIHAPLHSPHEASSVIREEFEELWEHVKADTGTSPEARKEAIQLGAMAMRYVLNLIDQPR